MLESSPHPSTSTAASSSSSLSDADEVPSSSSSSKNNNNILNKQRPILRQRPALERSGPPRPPDDDDDDDHGGMDKPHHHHHHHNGLQKTNISSRLSSVIGNIFTLQEGHKEVRQKPRNMTYEPTHHWWQPPLSAWFPQNNREIFFLLVGYYGLIVVLARYTNLCGVPSDMDVTIHQFCADDWILLEDQALTGTAVGMFLLLAFRANQAYDRFWEGRRMWGRMKEVCRDFARLVCHHVTVRNRDDREDRRRTINFLAAFAITTKLHLRKERDVYRDLERLGVKLSLQDTANIQQATHMPLFCLDILSHYLATQVQAGNLSDYQLGIINTTVMAVLSDSLGSCERLQNTPIPLSYVLQLRFFLMLWLLMYPLHVVAYYGWWTLLLASLIAYAVLGIDSMACEIENPFGYMRNDLDLDQMVVGFFTDTQAILQRAEDRCATWLFDRKSVVRLSTRQMNLDFLKDNFSDSEGPDDEDLTGNNDPIVEDDDEEEEEEYENEGEGEAELQP